MEQVREESPETAWTAGVASPAAAKNLFAEGAEWLGAQGAKFAAPLKAAEGGGPFAGLKGQSMAGALVAGALLGGPAGMAVAGVVHLATGGWLGRQATRAMLAVAAVGLSVAGRIYDALGRVYPDELGVPRVQRDLMGALGADDLFGTDYRANPPLKSVAALERQDRLAEERESISKTTKTDPSNPSAGGAGAAVLVKAIGKAEGPKPSVSKPEIAVARGASFTEKDLEESKKRLSGDAGASRSQREAEERSSSPKTTKTNPTDSSAGGAGAAVLVKAIGQAEGPKPSVSKPEIAVSGGFRFTDDDLAAWNKEMDAAEAQNASREQAASRSQREAERVRRMEERESAQAAQQADFVKKTGLRPLGQNELQERVSRWRVESGEKAAVQAQAPTRGMSR
jgi:hypothetical protein